MSAGYAALDLLTTLTLVVQPDGAVVFANAAFEDQMRLSRRTAQRGSIFDWFEDSRQLREALQMHGFAAGRDPVAVALEWGVRQLDQRATIRTGAGHEKLVRLDLFPAYDEDGGLLCSLAPLLGVEAEPAHGV